jgi:tetratricopeptide (TPR) repeat protein
MAEASAHLDAGRYSQAVEILKPLADKNPESVAVHFNLALANTLAGNDADAIAGFRKALTLKPDLYEARLNLAQLLVKTGQFAEAAPLLDQCLSTKPADPKAAYLLARAHAGQSNWPLAASAFEAAAKLNPGDKSILLELAAVQEKAQLPAKAAAIYAAFPDDPAAQERRGLILLRSGDYPGAIASLELARATGPSPAVLYALATAYLRNHQPDLALPLAAKLAEMEPSNQELVLFYGRLLRDRKRYEDAAPLFLAAVKLKPDSGEAWNELTAVLLLLKRYEPALAALEKARSLNGETPAYHYLRATMLDALNQPQPALESYLKFLSVSQDKFPGEEFKARQRVKVLKKVVDR